MPTYEYECLPNGHRFEVKQSFTDSTLTECVECGEPVRKIYSAAGIVFKGSGYYVTDSRKPATSNGSSSQESGDKSSSDKAPGDSGSGDKSSSGSADSGGSAGGGSTGGGDAKPSRSSSAPAKADAANTSKSA